MNNLLATVKRLREAADTLDALLTDKPTPTRKESLLQHYATGSPTPFTQIDGFILDGPDSVMNPDENGLSVMVGETYELRHSPHDVRLQIRSGTPATTAVALIEKILQWTKVRAKEEGETAFTLHEYPMPTCAMNDEGAPF